jgi:NADPH:quinone reductase
MIVAQTPRSADMTDLTTRAARLHEHRKPLQVESVERREPGPEEVVVSMAYAGVNPLDRYVALGRVQPDAPLPRILGTEGAGHLDGRPVVVHGSGVGLAREGVFAETAVVPADTVVDVPAGLDLTRAAAMGIAGVTAWRTVHELARVGGDDRVLVLGATGGVGSTIVSMVHAAGAEVWGQTGSAAKGEWLAGQGADRTVVVDAAGLVDAVQELAPTVVFDPLGDAFTGAALEALSPTGRLVSFGTSADPRAELNMQVVYRKSITIYGYGGMIEPQDRLHATLGEAMGALAAGRFQLAVDDVLPLDDVNEAFRRLEHREVKGKLVLRLRAGRL